MNLLNLLKKGIRTHSAEETIAIAAQITEIIPKDHVLALHGNLGVGKTTFVKGLAQGWKFKETITSPTFNIYTIYQGERNLLHLDAYRLKKEDDIENLFLDELLISPYCMVVEWPENIPSLLPLNTWHIYLSIEFDQSHLIQLK